MILTNVLALANSMLSSNPFIFSGTLYNARPNNEKLSCNHHDLFFLQNLKDNFHFSFRYFKHDGQ